MSETEIELTIAAELAGTGAPAWVAPLLRDVKGLRSDVTALALEVRGGGSGPGHAEQLRGLAARIAFLEGLVKWAAGIGTVIVTTAVAGIWSAFSGGPRH